MFKLIIFTFLFMNLSWAIQDSRVEDNNRMTFREFAKLSAIVSQCELNFNSEKINKFAKYHGLKLARESNLSPEKIAQEVSIILYELDQRFPEEIPENICKTAINKFEMYQEKVNNENKE